ncbi:MAG: Maf family protein, partial [Pontibacterium sp.]
VESFSVTFRELSQQMVEAYIAKEQPLNCAGSFKSEGLGIALFEKMQGEDPNSLVGLPLIKLCSFLADDGASVL